MERWNLAEPLETIHVDAELRNSIEQGRTDFPP